VSKKKKNIYKILFYLLLMAIVAYIVLQSRKKDNQDYVIVRVPKSRCPVTMLMKNNLLVIDKEGKAHSESEWFSKKQLAKL